MNAFTIKDLENLSGIKAHTIRIWEQRYSFLKPQRSTTNIRYYDSEELKKLLNIALLNKYGFKISHIDKMDEAAIREKLLSLDSSEAQVQRLINQLLHGMIDLDTTIFENILDEHINRHGIDKTIQDLIFPFLQRIGILWLTDHVRIAHEHLVSNLIRQKLIRGIEQASPLQMNGRTVVMFLPQSDYHELGLLYMYYLLKVRGVEAVYLGADVPNDELEYVCKIKKPDFLYTHMISLPPRFSLEKFLTHMQTRMNNTPIVISGRVLAGYSKKLPENVFHVQSIEEAILKLAG